MQKVVAFLSNARRLTGEESACWWDPSTAYDRQEDSITVTLCEAVWLSCKIVQHGARLYSAATVLSQETRRRRKFNRSRFL